MEISLNHKLRMKSLVLGYLSELINNSDNKIILLTSRSSNQIQDSNKIGYSIQNKILPLSEKMFFAPSKLICNIDESNQYNMF